MDTRKRHKETNEGTLGRRRYETMQRNIKQQKSQIISRCSTLCYGKLKHTYLGIVGLVKEVLFSVILFTSFGSTSSRSD